MAPIIALWRRLDAPGHDACQLERARDGWLLHGAAIYCLEGVPVRLQYSVKCDKKWRATEGQVTGLVGGQGVYLTVEHSNNSAWTLNGVTVAGLDDCQDLDFGFTPATNALQLRRLALESGQSADVPVAWLDVPEGKLQRLEQSYQRMSKMKYQYDAPRFDYHALLVVGSNSLVQQYPGLWEAEC
jgi:uncharacterized protein